MKGKKPDAVHNSIHCHISMLPVALPLWLFLNYLSPPTGFDVPENTSVVCIAYKVESTGQADMQSRLVHIFQDKNVTCVHEDSIYCLGSNRKVASSLQATQVAISIRDLQSVVVLVVNAFTG